MRVPGAGAGVVADRAAAGVSFPRSGARLGADGGTGAAGEMGPAGAGGRSTSSGGGGQAVSRAANHVRQQNEKAHSTRVQCRWIGAVGADLEVGPAEFILDLLIALLHPVAQAVQAHDLRQIGGPEKRYALLKGPLAVRPILLHKQERVLSLVCCTIAQGAPGPAGLCPARMGRPARRGSGHGHGPARPLC